MKLVKVQTRVVNKNQEPFDVYVGRGSPYGNPYKIGSHGTRAEVIAKYEKWLRSKPALVAQVKRELRGKVLGCFCKPLSCHGDILARVADEKT